MAKTRGAWALGSVIQKIRSLFKYGYDAGLIDKPMRYGPAFKRPGMAAIRRERLEKGPRTFTAAEIHSLLEIASVQIKAMILLAINCGLGNSDCGQVRHSNIDLVSGWLTYPRPKTGIDRRCPLWKETITALRAAIDNRPARSDTVDQELVFLTKYGRPWEIDRMCNPISHEFRKLLLKLDLHRPGLSFYAIRHTFATEAGATRDQVAVNAIMGHADQSMAAVYRERIDDDRLRAVTAPSTARLRSELLDAEIFENVREAQALAAAWHSDYNHYRPHCSLDYQTPARFAAATIAAMVPAASASLRVGFASCSTSRRATAIARSRSSRTFPLRLRPGRSPRAIASDGWWKRPSRSSQSVWTARSADWVIRGRRCSRTPWRCSPSTC